jgi:hypothetical protein
VKRDQLVRVRAGWMTDQVGYIQRIDGYDALVMIPGAGFPFPRLATVPLEQLEVVDLRARDRAVRESVGEAPF